MIDSRAEGISTNSKFEIPALLPLLPACRGGLALWEFFFPFKTVE